jgi:hypothetical protein
MFAKGDGRDRGHGRPVGSVNEITRTMKDAAIAAAEELGHIPYKDWAKSLIGDPENGIKEYFKLLAVIAELREAGLPIELIKHMHAVDALTRSDCSHCKRFDSHVIPPIKCRLPPGLRVMKCCRAGTFAGADRSRTAFR